MTSPAGKFVWPPRPPAPDRLPAPPPRHRPQNRIPSPRRGPISLLEALEQEWLDVTSEPIARRIARGEWTPDSPDAYCGRCGRSVGPHEADDAGCGSCRGTRPPWARIVRLGAHEGALRDMIVEVKFTRFRRLGRDLGTILGEAVLAAAATEKALSLTLTDAIVVPVPTTARRRVSRGIDHTAVIARAVAERLEARFLPALARRHVPSQLMVAPSRRAANVAGTMRLRRGVTRRLGNHPVLVVDDVCTTSATMRTACRAIRDGLRQAGIERPTIWAAVLARAAQP